jgi:isoquinoline 1-oxidoreductase subunit beta
MSTFKTEQLAAELPHFLKKSAKGPQKAQGLPPVNRRDFFKISGIAGGGLAIGLAAGVSPSAKAQAGSDNLASLSPYVQIKADGRINIFSKNPECGQGIKTGLPIIIAEELDCRWEDVDVMQADIDATLYGAQFAGGSLSTPMNWMGMRQAGATARAMILAGAAAQLDVPLSELTTSETKVIHAASGQEYGYGEFAEIAATMPVPDPETLTLKDISDFSVMGKRYTGVDNNDIVQGKPLFGIDQVRPDMVYATYTKSPRISGVPTSFNDAHIKSLDGVIDAFIVEPFGDAVPFNPGGGTMFGGVAIVATSTWAAIKAKRELEIEWNYSNAATASWSDSVDQAYALEGTDGPMEIANSGDVDGAMASAATVVEGFYEYPYVSHMNLEPQNCTAIYENGELELWAPSQLPQNAETGAALVVGIAEENSVLHQTRIGGGFGRRLGNDYAFEVAAIAKRLEGTPVKLQWTREDDFAYDYFRPGGFHSYKAAIDNDGRLTAFQNHFVTFTGNGESPMSGGEMNANVFPMDVLDNVKVTQTMLQAAIPTGPMRAPASNAFGFTFQSFLHECSVAAGKDHVEFLLETLGEFMPPPADAPPGMHVGRAANVIKAVAENAGWGREMPAGRGLGLAFYFSHNGYVAQVADVSVTEQKEITVHKVWAVSDVGYVHNLSSAENQVQGGILDGLSQLMTAKVTFENGAIEQSNLHQYPMLRISRAPELDVAFLEPTEFTPSGVGEPSLPPALPAIANAIYAASGVRVRKAPLSELGYTLV